MTHHTYHVREPEPSDPMLRTFRTSRVLSGFISEAEFRTFAEMHSAHYTPDERLRLDLRAAASRSVRASLTARGPADVIFRAVDARDLEAVVAAPAFVANFGALSHEFAWISPGDVIPLQIWAAVESHSLSGDPGELLRIFLPPQTATPLELNFAGPQGPVLVTSSAPHASRFAVNLGPNGVVAVTPAGHVNLVQIARWKGRFFVRNGTHRLVHAVAAGVVEVPALIVDASSADQVLLNLGANGFSPDVVLAERPPLIADFVSDLALEMPMRAQRFGYVVTVTPLALPI